MKKINNILNKNIDNRDASDILDTMGAKAETEKGKRFFKMLKEKLKLLDEIGRDEFMKKHKELLKNNNKKGLTIPDSVWRD